MSDEGIHDIDLITDSSSDEEEIDSGSVIHSSSSSRNSVHSSVKMTSERQQSSRNSDISVFQNIRENCNGFQGQILHSPNVDEIGNLDKGADNGGIGIYETKSKIRCEASCSYSKNPRKYIKRTIPKTTELTEQNAEEKSKKVAKDSQALTFKSSPLKMKQNVGQKNRCGVCNVRLGLCAVRCRCDNLYCAKHRYDSEHRCTFDYKSMGAEEIRKNNPRVIAEKVRKL